MNDILNGLTVKLTVIFAVIANAFNDTFDRFSESVISSVFESSDGASCVKESVEDGNDIEEIRKLSFSDPASPVIDGAVITFAASKKSAVESVLNRPSERESASDSEESESRIKDNAWPTM